MKKFEIHIGKIYDLENKVEVPICKVLISQEQLYIIEMFAHTRKDKDLNTICILNDCEFTVVPKIFK